MMQCINGDRLKLSFIAYVSRCTGWHFDAVRLVLTFVARR